jgi:RecA-family ATPase
MPMVTLSKDSVVEPISYAVFPLVYKNKTTVLYGDGGLGKSTFALFIGMGVSIGYPVLGMRCQRQGVLYLDYEDDENTHGSRLKAIQEGHPELITARVEYMNLVEPLHLHVHDIMRKITESQCSFIVLDSLLCATGGDSSAEGATKLNLAFRKLNCSVLSVGHVAKGSSEAGPAAKTVYGSVFFQNLARSTFEVETHQEIGEGQAEIALTHRKHNLSRAHPSIGVRVVQDEQTTYIHYELCNLEEIPELSRALPLWQRIRKLMESSPPLQEEEIVRATGAPRSAVSGSLCRYRGKYFEQTSPDRGSPWTICEG